MRLFLSILEEKTETTSWPKVRQLLTHVLSMSNCALLKSRRDVSREGRKAEEKTRRQGKRHRKAQTYVYLNVKVELLQNVMLGEKRRKNCWTSERCKSA